MNYSYVIHPNFCEGTLRNFDPTKNYLIFSPFYAQTNPPIRVPIEYLRCVEGGATKCTHGHTFNLLYRDRIADHLDNRETSQEETQILKHLLAMQPHCNLNLAPLLFVWRVIRISWPFSAIQTTGRRTSSSNIGRRPQTYSNTLGLQTHKMRLTVLKKTHLKKFSFSFFLFRFCIVLIFSLLQIIFCPYSSFFPTRLKTRISFFLPSPGRE